MLDIPGYTIQKTIGMGGMGIVYLAKHNTLGRYAAVKVLMENLSNNPEIRQRFVQEANLMGRMNHPNVVALYDFTTEPQLSLVMEFVDGKPLDEMIGREVGPFPFEKAIPLFKQILSGIGYAHRQGVIHRDIKPSNILISSDGTAKVTDLGIAKIAGQKGMTKTGAKVGTLYYMSPEQVRGDSVDTRADIYSLGMTLYEMLAGRLPFEESGDTSEYQIMTEIIKRPGQLDPRDHYPHIPDWLIKIVQKATALNPSARFQDCESFLQAIEEQAEDLPEIKTSIVSQPVSEPESKSVCRQCGLEYFGTQNFCPGCGKKNQRFCVSCGQGISADATVCKYCGTNTYSEAQRSSNQLNAYPVNTPAYNGYIDKSYDSPLSKKGLWVFIGVIFGIYALSLIVLGEVSLDFSPPGIFVMLLLAGGIALPVVVSNAGTKAKAITFLSYSVLMIILLSGFTGFYGIDGFYGIFGNTGFEIPLMIMLIVMLISNSVVVTKPNSKGNRITAGVLAGIAVVPLLISFYNNAQYNLSPRGVRIIPGLIASLTSLLFLSGLIVILNNFKSSQKNKTRALSAQKLLLNSIFIGSLLLIFVSAWVYGDHWKSIFLYTIPMEFFKLSFLIILGAGISELIILTRRPQVE